MNQEIEAKILPSFIKCCSEIHQILQCNDYSVSESISHSLWYLDYRIYRHVSLQIYLSLIVPFYFVVFVCKFVFERYPSVCKFFFFFFGKNLMVFVCKECFDGELCSN